MKKRILCAAVVVLVSAATTAQEAPSSSAVEKELRELTQEMLDAIAPGRADVWRRLLHERMLHVDESGTVRTRDQLLAEFQPLPAGLEGTLRIASFQAQVHGDVAVATHEEHETLIYFGQKLESRYRTTDTWIRTPEGWRLIAAQVLAIHEDPPAIRLSASQLCAYEGVYALTSEITTTIRCRDAELVSERTGRPATTFRPETADVFFQPGQPRTRRIFQRDDAGRVVGFVDRREGHDIKWRKIR